MMYSDTDILAAIERGEIVIEPFNNKQLGANSYDIKLGDTFFEVFHDRIGPYYVGPYVYRDGEAVDIPVGGTLLGITKESVSISGKVVASIFSRSTKRREAKTTNCDAGLGDIGYKGPWTLELTSFVSGSIVNELLINWCQKWSFLLPLERKLRLNRPYMVVGETVAQVVFYECHSEPTRLYDGQYKADWPLNMIPEQWRHRVVNP